MSGLNDDDLLTERQAVPLLNVSVFTLQKWRVTGEGPAFVKMGRAVRYRRRDLRAFVESRIRKSTTE